MRWSERTKETSTAPPLGAAALTTGLTLAGLIIAIIVLSGTAGGIRSLEAVTTAIADTLARSPKPFVASFGLSSSARGYIERREPLFGSSSYAWRTFVPVSVFGHAPVAIFSVTLRNPGAKDLVITELAYDIADVGQRRRSFAVGGPSRARYHYALRHEIGVQYQPVPPLRIVGGATASFELQLTSALDDADLGWLMRIGLVTDRGTLFTDTFQLYLPKPAASARNHEKTDARAPPVR